MQENAGIVREATKLQKGLKRILELKKEFYAKDNIILRKFKIDENVVRTWEVKSALVVCEAVIKSALMCKRVEELTIGLTFLKWMTKGGR